MAGAAELRALLGRVEACPAGGDRGLDAILSAAFRVVDPADGVDTSWHSKAIFAPMGESVVVALKTDDLKTTRAWCGSAQRLTGSPLLRAVIAAGLRALIAQAVAPPSPGGGPAAPDGVES